ncbi:RNA-directed DNA polymerase, eukaryota, reverse transcriptase zinc-binding domain protein [Tanacetum coccineum]
MSSFFAMNWALLFKWIWRFKVLPEALWVSVIKAIHGPFRNLDRDIPLGMYFVWLDCVRGLSQLKGRGVDLFSCMHKNVGNGNATLFWSENWMGDGFLNIKYPRLLALEGNKEVSVGVKVNNGLLFGFRRSPRGGAESMQFEDLSNKLCSIELVDEQDSWSWNLNGEGGFTVSSARRFIDDGICGINGSCTKWVNLIPIKVNILAWRVALNKLPTRFNMSLRGMEVSTMECPVCRVGNETSDHLFFSCSLAAAMISRLFKWWELPDMFFHSYHGWENWLDGLRLRKERPYPRSTTMAKKPTTHKVTKEPTTTEEVIKEPTTTEEVIKKFGRSMLSIDIALQLNAALQNSFRPYLKDELCVCKRLDEGRLKKYGDYLCCNILRICEILRSQDPNRFRHTSPKTIAKEIMVNFVKSDMIRGPTIV